MVAGSLSFLVRGKTSDGRHCCKRRSNEEEASEPRRDGRRGFSPPSPFIVEEGQPAPPAIIGNDDFPCMSQGLVKSSSCRCSMGKWRCPRPINRHASTKAAGYWGPQRSALALWLCLEAKPEHALGPGATVGVLGMGVPRLACLWPIAWLCWQAYMTHLRQQGIKTLARGQAS